MAVRRPVKWDGTGFRDFTSSEVNTVVSEVIRLYGNNPSVDLSVVTSGGNLGTLSDTRLQAGTGQTRTDRFATTAELQDVSTITVNYSKINQSTDTVSINKAGYSWPLYRVSGGLRAMSSTDVYDTFISPAITTLSGSDSGTNTAGTYTISTATSVTNATQVSATPIFTDTRADASAYTAAGLLETRDQPITITNYYLHRWNAVSPFTFSKMIHHELGSTDATWISQTNMRAQLESLIRYHMVQEIGYNYSSGTARGTAMINTARTGSKYLTYQVGADDYRAQETPDYDAASSTINTYRLYILRS